MNKLYHLFYVFSYKGGELCSSINNTLKDIAETVAENYLWEDIKEYAADYECFTNMSDEDYFALSILDLLEIVPDELLEDVANNILYPGNTYAYDDCSDYECYTSNSEGKLISVNPIKEEGFIKFLREKLKEVFKYDK